MIAPEAGLSVTRQCALLGIARSSFYYRPQPESAEELDLLKRLDWYNFRRPHQSLGWRTPNEAYLGRSTTVTALAA